ERDIQARRNTVEAFPRVTVLEQVHVLRATQADKGCFTITIRGVRGAVRTKLRNNAGQRCTVLVTHQQVDIATGAKAGQQGAAGVSAGAGVQGQHIQVVLKLADGVDRNGVVFGTPDAIRTNALHAGGNLLTAHVEEVQRVVAV